MHGYIAPQLRLLKFWIKALQTTDKVLLLYHCCSVVDCAELKNSFTPSFAEETFGCRRVRPNPWRHSVFNQIITLSHSLKNISPKGKTMFWKEPQESLSTPFISHFHPEILLHFIKVEEQRKTGKPVAASIKIPPSAFLSPLPPSSPHFSSPLFLWRQSGVCRCQGASKEAGITRTSSVPAGSGGNPSAGQGRQGWVLSTQQTSQPCSWVGSCLDSSQQPRLPSRAWTNTPAQCQLCCPRDAACTRDWGLSPDWGLDGAQKDSCPSTKVREKPRWRVGFHTGPLDRICWTLTHWVSRNAFLLFLMSFGSRLYRKEKKINNVDYKTLSSPSFIF